MVKMKRRTHARLRMPSMTKGFVCDRYMSKNCKVSIQEEEERSPCHSTSGRPDIRNLRRKCEDVIVVENGYSMSERLRISVEMVRRTKRNQEEDILYASIILTSKRGAVNIVSA